MVMHSAMAGNRQCSKADELMKAGKEVENMSKAKIKIGDKEGEGQGTNLTGSCT